MRAAIVKRLVQVVLFLLVQAAVFFLSAGRLDYPPAWIVLGLYGGGIALTAIALARKCPELIVERSRIGPGAKRWDKWLVAVMGFLGPLGVWLVAGFDVRHAWSPQASPVAQAAGVLAAALGYALVTWAMVSNPFFAPVVRIQKERGHKVMSGGPYRFVRHPGYVGMMLFTLAMPAILGTLWAFVPAVLTLLVTVVRTALEDRTLQAELEGYRDYAARVRYRLVPGAW